MDSETRRNAERQLRLNHECKRGGHPKVDGKAHTQASTRRKVVELVLDIIWTHERNLGPHIAWLHTVCKPMTINLYMHLVGHGLEVVLVMPTIPDTVTAITQHSLTGTKVYLHVLTDYDEVLSQASNTVALPILAL